MKQLRKLEHQRDLSTRAAAYLHDVDWVRELRINLFRRYWHHQISDRAYELWEQAGHPTGRDLEFWLEAEREIGTGTNAVI
ncbi:DUF2934 domain-containing protein [Bradyrhizobium arachidis]|uniref:DUF2934 domain-containing protein n=1 Tax=Bradyrhizobium arachidis TaxID=858423 RepID=A0AAE7TEC0_9BRAD|nr:DUF2934 domain-containing protein [Bradyrhizobium arachidis]QOZ65917.1 DUF2934 domain-containing protein [Bradyrhizobium arachidis]SFV19520.1 Protein of unknown function [Bradyrhizobium arachidis]